MTAKAMDRPDWGVATVAQALQAQRGHLLNWIPLCLGLGIGGYFSLPFEPEIAVFGAVLALSCGLFWLGHLKRHGVGPILTGLAIVGLGLTMAGGRAHVVAGPTVDFRYYGPIHGRVVGLDRSASDKVRVTLDQVRLGDMAPQSVPRRVRVALHGDLDTAPPTPGAHVMLTGHLSQAPGPAEPGGFDFQRHAWFQKLGAVGYTRSPVLTVAPPEGGARLAVFRLRMTLSAGIQAAIPGQAGALAAAVTTGDRSGMSLQAVTDLRASNLAHLLAISGLHMGLLTAFVFGALRIALVLLPGVGLRAMAKKLAAAGALAVGAFYLAMSGGSVATERAFVMVAVALGAIIFDRRALTLRAVAVAAIIVLTLRPEALLSPGFQMSFAATTALVAIFGQIARYDMDWLPKRVQPAMSVFLSSLIAGLATAPLAAAHFNIVSHYGLAANLLSVPIMGAIVVPAAVFAAVLIPLGLSWIPLLVMEAGLRWILWVGSSVAGLEGAVGRVPSPSAEVLPILALGALFAVLWRGRLRWAGAPIVLLGLVLWIQTERPAVLISHSGGLVGWSTAEGRALSKPRGDRFAADVWLENDGDTAVQAEAFSRAKEARIWVGPREVIHVTGKAARKATCSRGQILVLNVQPDKADMARFTGLQIEEGQNGGQSRARFSQPCEVITPAALRDTGAIAFVQDQGVWRKITAKGVSGERLWNTKSVRRAHQVPFRGRLFLWP